MTRTPGTATTKGAQIPMALPALSAEARAEAVRKAAAVRLERGKLLARLKAGSVSLKEVLEREDDVVGRTRVRRLLESLPGISKVRAGQLMHDLGVSERRRVKGLGHRQKERLLDLFPPLA